MDPGKTGTLGMELIYGLTQQLSGSVTLDRGNGVHFIITFPARDLKKE
jgi:two-component sensor histidine kinase